MLYIVEQSVTWSSTVHLVIYLCARGMAFTVQCVTFTNAPHVCCTVCTLPDSRQFTHVVAEVGILASHIHSCKGGAYLPLTFIVAKVGLLGSHIHSCKGGHTCLSHSQLQRWVYLPLTFIVAKLGILASHIHSCKGGNICLSHSIFPKGPYIYSYCSFALFNIQQYLLLVTVCTEQ